VTAAPVEIAAMDHALRLARRGLGNVWPNPAVGCVILRDGIVAGRGWTQPGGRPHAETMALAQAGNAAQGATAIVTLEPCAHHGATPPCAAALIAAGVARVVTALTDPDPRVAGGGHAMLRAAGIEVIDGIREAEAREVNRGFLLRLSEGRPLLTLKLALSLDGRIATAAGESRWITGPAARARVQALRATHDAVLVGGGTARADHPALTVRDRAVPRQPVRVIATAGVAPILPEGGEVWLPADLGLAPQAGDLDLAALMRALAARGITRVLCEGGGRLAAALLRADLVDVLEVHAAGVAIGADGRAGLGPLELAALSDAPRFALQRVWSRGGDVLTRWTPR